MASPSRDRLSELARALRVLPGASVELPGDHDPGFTGAWRRKKEAADYLRAGVEMLADHQERLAAQGTHAVLVVLQGIDASGKDGTIRHVMSGVNPQGVFVRSFKVPSADELAHDFLWRYQQALPARGQIGIFNRSQYEEVLVVRVHPELLDRQRLPHSGPHLWHQRYRAINDWERHLHENGIHMVKLFLHLSREEQRRRFLARIDRAEKNWKLSVADVRERECWDAYQHAFSQMLSHTSTEWAPWHVIPADHKWFARLATAAAIVDALAAIGPEYPTPSPEERAELERVRVELEAQAPPGAAPDPVRSPSGD